MDVKMGLKEYQSKMLERLAIVNGTPKKQMAVVGRQIGKSQMAGDLLASWKENKFIVVDSSIIDDYVDTPHLVILTDIAYWADNSNVLIEWCDEYKCRFEGMTVVIPDEPTLALFVLRWS